jgi:hypothetical protein
MPLLRRTAVRKPTTVAAFEKEFAQRHASITYAPSTAAEILARAQRSQLAAVSSSSSGSSSGGKGMRMGRSSSVSATRQARMCCSR